MKDTLDRKPRILVWSDTRTATAPDGTNYSIFSEHVRGEARVFWASLAVIDAGRNWPRWKPVSDSSEKPETAMNAAERHAREHHATAAG